jgi:cysteine desulfurase
VLVAMGALTSGNVRVSVHPATSAHDVERFLDAVGEVVAEVRSRLPASKPSGGTTIDSRGRRCPLPIIDLARAIGGVPVGEVVTVLADDPAAASDVAAWCRMRGHEFVDATPLTGQATAYRVRRSS